MNGQELCEIFHKVFCSSHFTKIQRITKKISCKIMLDFSLFILYHLSKVIFSLEIAKY